MRQFCAIGLVSTASLVSASANVLYSIDFGRSGDTDAFSGVESAAAAANDAFNSANIWNILEVPLSPATTNPSFSNLLDSTGASTSAALSITGTLGALNGFILPDTLTGDYLFFSDSGTSAQLDFTMSGLTASGGYSFYTYNSDFSGETYFLTIDTDGDGDLGDESSLQVNNGTDGYVPSVIASGTGDIIGRLDGVAPTNQSQWAGFQIASIPEPSSALLLFTATLALFPRRRGQW